MEFSPVRVGYYKRLLLSQMKEASNSIISNVFIEMSILCYDSFAITSYMTFIFTEVRLDICMYVVLYTYTVATYIIIYLRVHHVFS